VDIRPTTRTVVDVNTAGPPPPTAWYPDPIDTSRLRWWTGVAWSDTVHGWSAARPALASPARRAVARTIDTALVGGVQVAVSATVLYLSLTYDWTLTRFLLGLLAVGLATVFAAGYELVCIAHWGATLGKRCAGIRVICADGSVSPGGGLGYLRSIRRLLLAGLLEVGVVSIGIGWVCAAIDAGWLLFDGRGQSLHDKLAGTVVVRR
jgi:uncharacterized RDD family membrane protein YckC